MFNRRFAQSLSARYYKDGSEILIPQGKNKPPRRLTPRECAKLMGFDERVRERTLWCRTHRHTDSLAMPFLHQWSKRLAARYHASSQQKLMENGSVLKLELVLKMGEVPPRRFVDEPEL